MGQIDRIARMELLLDTVLAGNDPDGKRLQTLARYMESGLWLRDFEADEAGLLPKGLKRGVLAEDTLYNLLAENGKDIKKMYYQELLARFVDETLSVYKENVVGIYLHGSLAMGCFNPEKSDLDLLVILDEPPTDAEKLLYLNRILALNESAPEKGIEMSIVQKRYCDPFVYPTPYEFHYSNAHRELANTDKQAYIEKLHGVDPDLAAHFTITRAYGVCLYGLPVDEVFGEVPKADYFDSIRLDIENAAEDVTENPVYVILNLCRVLGYLRDGLILSKLDGGRWGLNHCPDHADVIEAALDAYISDRPAEIDMGKAINFAKETVETIFRESKGDLL